MPEALARAESYSASRVTASSFSDTVVFYLEGELNRGSAAGLRTKLRAAVGESRVIFDLTGVVFIDSIGVGVLLGAIRSIHEHGGVVAIGGADPRQGVTAALRSAGVERLAFLSESQAGAMQWLRQDRQTTSGRGA